MFVAIALIDRVVILTAHDSNEMQRSMAEKEKMAEKSMMGGMMPGQGMKEKKRKMKDMYSMYGMMKAMMNKEIVATKNGGAIVMISNKVLKYDKKLNLRPLKNPDFVILSEAQGASLFCVIPREADLSRAKPREGPSRGIYCIEILPPYLRFGLRMTAIGVFFNGLNVVREAEILVDAQGMKSMMRKMVRACPMYRETSREHEVEE